MPNWCEGTLKVRGDTKAIQNFIENGLNRYKNVLNSEDGEHHLIQLEKSQWLNKYEDGWGDEYYVFQGNSIYVEDTKRAFIQPKLDRYFIDDIRNYICFDFAQAWDIKTQDWVNLSKKWKLDFRLFGIERGGMFCRDVEVINGNITLDRTIEYEDWDWECPFSEIGG